MGAGMITCRYSDCDCTRHRNHCGYPVSATVHQGITPTRSFPELEELWAHPEQVIIDRTPQVGRDPLAQPRH
jgi:hypothetical protein